MKIYDILFILFVVTSICSCNADSSPTSISNDSSTPVVKETATRNVVSNLDQQIYPSPEIEKWNFEALSYETVRARLEQKIKNNEPLVAHIMVPLCDNKYQGIVPVSKSLGDGGSTKTNLYWGAAYGIKTYFKKQTNWELVTSEKIGNTILERSVFKYRSPTGSILYLVADAYRGMKMQACLHSFLGACSGKKNAEIKLDDATSIAIYGGADLIGFNGHNGIMDGTPTVMYNQDKRIREALVIGCVSYPYFKNYLNAANTYPLFTTTNLLAPEAYILHAVLENWVELKSHKEIHTAAAVAYDNYQKCGIRGAGRLFQTGDKLKE